MPGHPPNFSGQRNAGVPVETPEVTTGFLSALDAGGTLRARAAFWLPLLALFNARVRLNWRGSLWPSRDRAGDTYAAALRH
jgi:hypothetical protein